MFGIMVSIEEVLTMRWNQWKKDGKSWTHFVPVTCLRFYTYNTEIFITTFWLFFSGMEVDFYDFF